MGGRGLSAAAASGGAKEINNAMWPQLTGSKVMDAIDTIESDRPDVHIKLFGAHDRQPYDFDPHRVCLFVDDNLIVVRMPSVG